MRTTRVYIDAELACGRVIELERAQGHYLKNVLRLKPGAAFFLFDGRAPVDYEATLVADGKRLRAEIGAAHGLDTESSLESEIISGLGRSDHTDWMIQKTTELGVDRITLFNAERTQSPLKSAPLEKKLHHWRGVAISACEQCGRAILPAIGFHRDLGQALDACKAGTRLLLDFGSEPLSVGPREAESSVAILLGPEGGLDRGEIDLAREAGFRRFQLGPRVLRFETAATAALAIVQSFRGDLGPT